MDPRLSIYKWRAHLTCLVTAGAESVEMEIEELDEDEAILEATVRFPTCLSIGSRYDSVLARRRADTTSLLVAFYGTAQMQPYSVMTMRVIITDLSISHITST